MTTSPEYDELFKKYNDLKGRLKTRNEEYEDLKASKLEIERKLTNAELHTETLQKQLDEASKNSVEFEKQYNEIDQLYKRLESDHRARNVDTKKELEALSEKLATTEASLSQMVLRHSEQSDLADKYHSFLKDYGIDPATGTTRDDEEGSSSATTSLTVRAMTSMMKTLERMNNKTRTDPPRFKGASGDKPEPHILKCEDYFNDEGITTVRGKVNAFRMTLESKAREWFEDIDDPSDWESLKNSFRNHFSAQGRSIKHLHERWRSFRFDPLTMEIETYISDVKQTAKQLNYTDAAVVDLLKSTTPETVYGILFDRTDLKTIIRILKDFYAHKPGEVTAPPATQTSPFSSLTVNSPTKSVTIDPLAELKDAFNVKFNTMMNKLNDNYSPKKRGGPKQRPYKPYITRGRGHRGGRSRDRSDSRPYGRRDRDRDSDYYHRQRRDSRDRRDDRGYRRGRDSRDYRDDRQRFSHRSRDRNRRYDDRRSDHESDREDYRHRRERSNSRVRFDRSPTHRKPKSNSRTIDKDVTERCHRCHQMGHWAYECPTLEDAQNNYLSDNEVLYGTEDVQTEIEKFRVLDNLFCMNEKISDNYLN